jgi:hypothetical protein
VTDNNKLELNAVGMKDTSAEGYAYGNKSDTEFLVENVNHIPKGKVLCLL